MRKKISVRYGALTVLLLSTEVLIALHVNDLVIRPFLGDFLATILVYCFCKTLAPSRKPANFAYGLSLGIELLQATPFLSFSGLDRCPPAAVVLGSHFSWIDVGMYTLAFAVLKALEKRSEKTKAPEPDLFVHPHSIVKKIWSDPDCLLLLFAAAAQEFAYHKKVDWLFFTGKLPGDPLGRMFSTLNYAQNIIFSTRSQALATLHHMKMIHHHVEEKRGDRIPDWAYKDVLYMLIDYTIRVGDWAYGPLSTAEKEEIYVVFKEVGEGMGLLTLPLHHADWESARQDCLSSHYEKSPYTLRLHKAYREHLGKLRFTLLLAVQVHFTPPPLPQPINSPYRMFLTLYRPIRKIWPISRLKYHLLPDKHAKSLASYQKPACGRQRERGN